MAEQSNERDILRWARALQAMSQNGFTYSRDHYDVERSTALRNIAAEMLSLVSGLPAGQIASIFADQRGHATPKVDVRGVVFRDDKILLVKERVDGKWTVPGGWADVNETPSQATVREVWEESGFHTEAVKLLALYDRDHPRHGHTPHALQIYKVFFLCRITGGEPTPSNETEEVAFFAEGEIPELSMGRVTPSEIATFYQHLRRPDLPADFD